MYSFLRLTKAIIDNHIRDLGLFKFSYFLSKSTTFFSSDDVRFFIFDAKIRPESLIIYEKLTNNIAGLLLLYPCRLEYQDSEIVILINKNSAIDHKEFAKTAKPLIAAKFQKEGLYCMRSSIMATENDQIRILETIGFEKEAHMKEQAYYELRYHDVLAYALFRDKL